MGKSRFWARLGIPFLVLGLWLLMMGGAGAAPRVVQVATVAELVEAIDSNTEIRLVPGTYNLSEYYRSVDTQSESWKAAHPHVVFYANTEMHIVGVENLTIKSAALAATLPQIVSERGSAVVLNFRDSRRVTLAGLVMGHELQKGYCNGSVLYFYDSRDIELRYLELYGCGTVGIQASKVQGLRAEECLIRDCSEGIMRMENSQDTLFEACRFVNNGHLRAASQIELALNEGRHCFRRCLFENNSGRLFPLVDGLRIEMEDCILGGEEQAFAGKYPGICKIISDGQVQEVQEKRTFGAEDFALCFLKTAGAYKDVLVKMVPGQITGERIMGILAGEVTVEESHEGTAIGLAKLEDRGGHLKLYLIGAYGEGIESYKLYSWETDSIYYELSNGLKVGKSRQDMLVSLGEPASVEKDVAGDDVYTYFTQDGARELLITIHDGKVSLMQMRGEI